MKNLTFWKSDWFLGLVVTLYQLSCGHLPFQGDSMAQLMFKIANEPHPDILTIRPDVPDCLVAIINRSLSKNPEERFQTGEEMAKAIRACAATVAIEVAREHGTHQLLRHEVAWPLMDLRLFEVRQFAMGSIVAFIYGTALFVIEPNLGHGLKIF